MGFWLKIQATAQVLMLKIFVTWCRPLLQVSDKIIVNNIVTFQLQQLSLR